MAITDFDRIIDIIEEDIVLGWTHILARISNLIPYREEEISDFLKLIDPEGRTLYQQYLYRRSCHAMNDYTKGSKLEQLAEKYDYTDAANISNEIKKKLGKSPKNLRKENFVCPKAQHLIDIIKESGMLSTVNEDSSKEINEQVIDHMKLNEEKYKSELMSAIDNIVALQNENTQLKSIIRRDQIKEQTNGEQIDMLKLTPEMYAEFLEIERCRNIYDLDTERVIDLYHKSISTGKQLEELCFEVDCGYLPKYEPENYELEKLAFTIEYEGSFDDMRREYFEDDDPADCEDDPYAAIDWEYEINNYKQYEDIDFEEDYEDSYDDEQRYDGPDDDEMKELRKGWEEIQKERLKGKDSKVIEINIEIDDKDIFF